MRRRLFSQSAVIFAVRIGGAGLVFLFQAVLARFWGADALGEYLIAIAAANILAVVMPLGFQTIATYWAADYAARRSGENLRRFVIFAYGQILLIGVPFAVLLGFALPNLGGASLTLARMWPAISLLALATAIVYVNCALLVGLKRPIAGFFADMICRPILVVGIFVALIAFSTRGGDIAPLVVWLSLGFFVVALAQFVYTFRVVLSVPVSGHAAPKQLQRWWYFALPWVLISLSGDFFFDIDLLMLSNLLSHDQLAVFGVCVRIFVLAAFGVSAVYSVVMPALMEEEAIKSAEGLDARIGDANLVATGLALMLLAAIIIFGPWALSLFGPEFAQGHWTLTILAAALVVRGIFGPASIVMSARNHPYASLPALAIGVGVLIVGNVLLVPVIGLNGAAISALMAIATGAALLWHRALRLTGVDVSIWPGLVNLVVNHRARKKA